MSELMDALISAPVYGSRKTDGDRQASFAYRALSKVARTLDPRLTVRALDVMVRDGGHVDAAWFNGTYPHCPARVGTHVCTKTVTLGTLMKKFEGSVIDKALANLQDNYADEPVALIFESPKDGFQELVVHAETVPTDGTSWRIRLPQRGLWIDPLKSVLVGLTEVDD